jgi:hypothetical protein
MAISGTDNPVDLIEHIRSLVYCMRGSLSFGKIKILSPIKPINLDQRIEYIKIPVLTYVQYNNFQMGEINTYIDTEYLLLVEGDGFITHPELWDNRFLDYDYIGAPWPDKSHYSHVRVGNGGFSLRSKKFMHLCSLCQVCNFNWDHLVCVTYRDFLLENGIKYAPLELAAKFSFESDLQDYQNSFNDSFGMHGKNANFHIITQSLLWKQVSAQNLDFTAVRAKK